MPITNSPDPFQVHNLAVAKRRRQERHKAERVVIILPEKNVWREALRRAQGNAKRLQTVAPNSVIVWNNETQRQHLYRKVMP